MGGAFKVEVISDEIMPLSTIKLYKGGSNKTVKNIVVVEKWIRINRQVKY